MGNHTFRLFLDNYDSKPNGEGEEGWATVIVKVKPTENVIANMSCNPAAVPFGPLDHFSGAYNQKRPATLFNLLSNFTW